jgi:medium-chain acyl-[acyl-carrier-protein] hydrolase
MEDKKVANLPVVDQWILYSRPRKQAQLRLFCFPYAGGGASIFRNWAEMLPSTIEVCPVQLPGRENRLLETPFSSISSLIEPLALALVPRLDLPFAFFGHSMGALISFELARYLRGKGYPFAPVHLFVSAHRAPQLPDPDPPAYYLPEAAFLNELRRLNGTPEEILQNPELLRLLLPTLRADFALCETYKYVSDAPLSCPITTFGGLQDYEVSYEMLTAWRQQTSSTFTLRYFAGDHFFLHNEQTALLQALSQNFCNV